MEIQKVKNISKYKTQSKLLPYFTTKACNLYLNFLQRHGILSTKSLNQGFLNNRPVLCEESNFTHM
jgi:hypothetical protein